MSAKVASVPQTYAVSRWGEGYFGINSLGHATACPRPGHGDALKLDEEAIGTEDLEQLPGRLFSFGELPCEDQGRDAAPPATRKADDALIVMSQTLEGGSRLTSRLR